MKTGKVLVWAGTEINGEKDKGRKGEKRKLCQLSVAQIARPQTPPSASGGN